VQTVVPPVAGHAPGTAGYRRLVAAVWAAGVGSFTLLYAPQALLPLLSQDLQVRPSTAALVISVATGTLALALVPVSALAERVGRTRLMTLALAAAAVLGLLAPLSPTIEVLLVVRALQGVAIAGLPALAMAHLSEEVQPGAVGRAMGLYVAGNTVGGLSGRLLASSVADVAGWRAGLAAVGVVALACVVAFRALLPPPTAGRAVTGPGVLLGHLRTHLGDPGVRRLCATGFVVMSAFVTVYNFLGYRLLEAPFGLSQTLVGLVFLTYLAGTLTAPTVGRLGDRVGRRPVLLGSVVLALAALVLTLSALLPLVLLGLVLFTVGFFGAHTSASGMVGNRARTGRSQASALYLLAYYAGSSVGGWVGGLAYEAAGWPGVVGYVGGLMVVALGLALLLHRTPPLAGAPAPAPAPAV
jgi:MFS transporter, YNFM family, putative membrane transport protein